MNYNPLTHGAGGFRDIACTRSKVVCLLLASLMVGCATAASAQIAAVELPDEPAFQSASSAQSTPQAATTSAGSISGVVIDPMGEAVAGARAQLSQANPPLLRETLVETSGGFVFANVEAGTYQLQVTAPGFASSAFTIIISAGQIYTVPEITLAVASANTDVEVVMSRTEVAQVQIAEEEKQRILGVVPNFYITYDPNAVALSSKQKFALAGRFVVDPVNFALTGVTAGIQQANDTYPSWGLGASGYAKRYAAATGTFLDAVFLGNAVLPSLLKQDPRYFYKGTGSVKSRIFYAIAMSVIAKGDNGKWQPNYSGIIGGLAAGGIANLYYPAQNRDGLGLTFSSAAIGTAEAAAGNLIQEFFLRKLTPHAGKNTPPADQSMLSKP